MYLARFSYNVRPVDRQRAIDMIRREVEAGRAKGFEARLLVPLTRAPDGAALQFEIELKTLDQLESFRRHGGGGGKPTADWMHEFSEILLCPPAVEILRVESAAG